MDRRAILAAILLGVMYVGNSGTYYAALETVSPSLAALVVYLYPAVVAVLSLRFGHRLSGRRAWIALGISLVGVVLAVGGIDPADSPPVSGLLLAFASCFIYAAWVVLAARLSGERREAVAADVDDTGSATAPVALIMTATATVYWLGALGDGSAGPPGGCPVGRLAGPPRRRRRGDLHRDPDVLRRRPAGRGGARLAHQHGRADLDDHPGGDPVLHRPDARPAGRRRADPDRRWSWPRPVRRRNGRLR